MKINTLTMFTICASMISTTVNAFNVDKMFVVADEKGNGIVTLINDEPYSVFVNGRIEQIDVVNNGDSIVRTDYTRSNLDDWKILLTHPRLVLKPGEEKDVGIRSLCHDMSCDDSKDLMFMLPFMPVRYKEDNDEIRGVEIKYGFSPVYVIPTSKPRFDYEIYNEGSQLRIDNDSNTLIDIYVDSCDFDGDKKCKQKFTVVSGRDKTFSLAENMQNEQLKVTVTSYDKKYSKTMNITKG
ncbi:hypothetical protein AB4279_07800 [Vibrio cyclitrophicus]